MTDDRKKPPTPGRWTQRALAAGSGLLAGFAALATAELVSAAVRPQSDPIVAVGGAAIDRTPPAVKDWAIQHFGTNDKLVLQSGILVVLALFALAIGIVALRFRRTGAAGVLVFGVVGAVAALSRPDSEGLTDALPSIVGAVVGAVLLYFLIGRLGSPAAAPGPATERPDDQAEETATGTGGGWDRRGFVIAASAAAAASAGAVVIGRSVNAASGQSAVASRDKVVLPRPQSPARPVPRGAQLRIPGISPFTTPNGSFYRVDTALVVPKVDATTWRLRVHGMGVRRPLDLSFADLLGRELIERDITLTCVSNEVGGPYVGNARWIGARLADLLAECGVKPPSKGGPATQLVARSVDGMTIGSPVEEVMDGRDSLLAVGMNGQPLPFTHGFPVRMLVPGLYGYVSACKWITDLELTTFDAYDPYWVQRGWSRLGPIKTESRIDTPKPFARPKAGTVMIAGVAWAQHRGIEKVEVRVDDGPWEQARLAAQDTRDTWRQWSYPWRADKGGHTLTVRATDGTGRTQTQRRTQTIPNGASGWHSVVVTVD
ncbi:molybdopterin-binding oxidoreductase [Streptomyces griseoviridis]|uniref:Molybdopterin-binding oxidoreductase n=1 Tax=Streptomyces griseoviridis TaxID=45398 RepID=A0A3S9Z5Q4_STRGD|nr:molybdopterin-dependent oxidoreductase [Streptomyces griseoviridis]AZS83097.1 molybdopterin-binding oxidoreductase [Streptomyces griseoviridis]QCN90049.1 molybdopterin-binding oxidoreductase [Streptomyces griseoviridis]